MERVRGHDTASAGTRDDTWFRTLLALLYAAGLSTFVYFLGAGALYYLTPVEERARHPLYWTFKPGGSLGLRFGMAGLAMMTVMHLYSARKRLRLLRKLGALRKWLDLHILMGILGPLFVVLHSSFKVGGLVSISFWSMVAVALSGVFGRYLYLQIPRTRAGEELTLAEVEKSDRELARRLREEFGADDAFLERLDRAAAPPSSAGLGRLLLSLLADDLGLRRRRLMAVARSLPGLPPAVARDLAAVLRQKALLQRRIRLWNALHRLFHYWHVVHRPFAVVMYLFVLVHIAVATMTGYGFGG
jgi:hypothetical protein